jgi:hypothetical protein
MSSGRKTNLYNNSNNSPKLIPVIYLQTASFVFACMVTYRENHTANEKSNAKQKKLYDMLLLSIFEVNEHTYSRRFDDTVTIIIFNS